MPENALGAGRIQHIDLNSKAHHGKAEIGILRDGKTLQFQLDPKLAILDCLIPGDLIAITAQHDVLLLAPARAKQPRVPFVPEQAARWNQYVAAVRGFFNHRQFQELKTPTLVKCPGTEPNLDIFSTELKIGSRRQKLFLPTSPELHLKKALALGAEKIFEIAPCFRNGEITERHQPEFLMLEWYRAYDNLSSVKKDVIELVSELAHVMKVAAPRSVKSFSVSELFKIHCDFEFSPETSIPELKALAEKLKVDVRSAETIDDFFFLIFMEKIEAHLDPHDLIFVEKYPPYQAALARLTSDGWGDRFEVYWQGMELANAFHELNDPAIQRLRSQEDLDKKKQMGKEEIFLDEEFFVCLEAGMPPSGGIALGVERLFMALTGVKEISHTKLFPYS
jgi:lysyl-tRNA synthetase-like protein GenX